MSTSRQEVDASAELWEWEALQSPLHNEMIYRRGLNTVFVQFDRGGVIRAATRYALDGKLQRVTGELHWTSPRKVPTVIAWFAATGARPVMRRPVGARR